MESECDFIKKQISLNVEDSDSEVSDEFPRSRHGDMLRQWIQHKVLGAREFKNDSTEFWQGWGCNRFPKNVVRL